MSIMCTSHLRLWFIQISKHTKTVHVHVAGNAKSKELVSVICFSFVVDSDHKHPKYLGRELIHCQISYHEGLGMSL